MPCLVVLDLTSRIAHRVRPEDMPPIRYGTDQPTAPGDAMCGAAFWWVTDGVTLTTNTAYFRGVLVTARTFPVNCVGCLGTVEE